MGLNVLRPENYVNKAVSDGAVASYIDHFVKTRVSKVAYGTPIDRIYDPTNPEHVRREGNTYISPCGDKCVRDCFYVILPKNKQVSETTEFRRPLFRSVFDKSSFKSYTTSIICYRGTNTTPSWRDVDSGNYSQLCQIVADLSKTPLARHKNPSKKIYYKAQFDVVLSFGLTELKAQVAWLDKKGIEQRSPAKIIYESDMDKD